MAILKRDGSVQDFDVKKVEMAVMKAMIASGSTELDASNEAFAIGVEIEAVAGSEEMISVAEIHTLVENALMDHCQNDAARAYIEYRKTRDNNREAQGKLYKDVQGFLDQTCDEFTKENANKPTKLVHTHRDLLAGILSKHMAVTQILPKEISEAHSKGFMHVHDLDYLISPLTNCVKDTAWVTVLNDVTGCVETLRLMDLLARFGLGVGRTNVTGYHVLSHNGWAKLNAVSARILDETDELFTFSTQSGGLKLECTRDHRIPVLSNRTSVLKYAKDIVVGDRLIKSENVGLTAKDGYLCLLDFIDTEYTSDLRITDVSKLKRWLEYTFDKPVCDFLREHDILSETLTITHGNSFNFRRMSVREFKKLLGVVGDLPKDVMLSLRISRQGAKYKSPLLISVTPELARALGYVFADGSVSSEDSAQWFTVCFTNTNESLLKDWLYCMDVVFPGVHIAKGKPGKSKTTPCGIYSTSSTIIWCFFHSFKRNSGDIEIPDFIMHGDDEIKYSFLGALWDCDGTCPNGQQTSYTTSSPVFAEQLVMLMQSLGVHATVITKHTKGTEYCINGVSGIRNYDNYLIRVSRKEDITALQDNCPFSIKLGKIVKCESKRISGKVSCEIVGIGKQQGNGERVVDLDTSNGYFIANGYVVHNCCLVNYPDMLKHGFTIGNATIGTPNSINVAATILSQIAASVSGSQYGGQTYSHIDCYLTPYVEKTHNKNLSFCKKHGLPESIADEMTEKDVYDSMQCFLYQINTLTSTNG